MDSQKIRDLEITAARVRILGLDAINSAASGHVGGAFSIADILTVLYFNTMKNLDPANPRAPERDRFVLSKGHCTAALYPTLALRGFFPVEDLKTFRQVYSYLSGHAEMNHVPGVDMSAGSLGQGLSNAVGMALAGKQDGMGYRVFCAMGDGEIQEGQIWEAAMCAGKYRLDNLVGIVDYNHLQIDGTVEEVMPLEPLGDRWASFGWNVIHIDGHNIDRIDEAFRAAEDFKGKPTVVIAHTVKGKGVSFMENNVAWHGHPPVGEDYIKARAELVAHLNELEGK